MASPIAGSSMEMFHLSGPCQVEISSVLLSSCLADAWEQHIFSSWWCRSQKHHVWRLLAHCTCYIKFFPERSMWHTNPPPAPPHLCLKAAIPYHAHGYPGWPGSQACRSVTRKMTKISMGKDFVYPGSFLLDTVQVVLGIAMEQQWVIYSARDLQRATFNIKSEAWVLTEF